MAGTVEATPDILREHHSYIDLHRIELFVYRLDRDSNDPTVFVKLATLGDPVDALRFAKDANGPTLVMAENYGPYWRWKDPDHVMPWALTAYVAWKRTEFDRCQRLMFPWLYDHESE